MSYILDALKKSERERAPARTFFSETKESIESMPFYRQPWLLGGGAALLLLFLAGFYLWWGGAASDADLDSGRVGASVSAQPITGFPSGDASPKPGVRALAAQTRSDPGGNRLVSSEPETASGTGSVAKPDISLQSNESTTIKFLRAMPPEFRRNLPPLAVNIHVYAPEASQRILYINNRQYHRGDQVAAGVMVEEIVQDGAVLSRNGVKFKLARPK